MPGGKTKFNISWLTKELDGVSLKNWCSGTDSVFSARCLLCSETFDISNSGFAQIKSHHKGKKHKLKFQDKFQSQSIIHAFNKASENKGTGEPRISGEDALITKAETLWAMKVAQSNISFKSCSETVDLFKEMFPDSSIAAGMQMKEKKTAYVISHGLATYFDEDLKKDISNSGGKVSVAFDETTNSQVKHQLDIYIRYWSCEMNSVSCRYLTSVFLGHATADILLKELLDAFSSFNVSLERILCISMDSPNVNKSLLRKLNDKIKNDCGKETLELGFCNLHVVSNSFKQLLNALQFEFDEFATDIHYFFKHSAARRQDFKAVHDITDVTVQFLLHHVSNRWLTVGPVAERILDQWPNISEYFLNYLPSQKSFEKALDNNSRYKRIRSCLKDELTPCYLSFILFTHKYFEKFSLIFQSETPQIHRLYTEINHLIRNVMAQFLQDDLISLKSGHDLDKIDLESSVSWKPLKDMEIGTKTKNLLINIKEKKTFFLDVRAGLIKTIKYMKSNLPFCNEKLKNLEILMPRECPTEETQLVATSGLHEVTKVCSYLNFPEELTDKIRREWKLLNCDRAAIKELSKFITDEKSRIDYYWRTIFNMHDSFGQPKFENISKLVKSCLVLPHGNADPERGFSVNNAAVTKEKNRLGDMTITSLRIVKDAIKHYGCISKVPITTAMLMSVKNAHKHYSLYLEKLKEEEERQLQEKRKKQNEKNEKLHNKKLKMDLDAKLEDTQHEMHLLKKDKEAAFALIQEGTERMKKAITSKNHIELTVAQNIITQGSDQLKELEKKIDFLETEKGKLIQKRFKI